MPITLSIRNVPDDLAERLRERAKLHHRSLQGELLALLEQHLEEHPESHLENVRMERRGHRTVRELSQSIDKLGLRTGSESTAWVREDRDAR